MHNNDVMTCRLLAASAVSYWIERDGGLTSCPLYNSVNYVSTPTILEGGTDNIDAITVGSTTDGCVIVACRGTLSSTTADDNKQVILDWINNLKVRPIQVPDLPDGCRAHDGFLKAVNLVRTPSGKDVFEEVSAQLAAIGSNAKLFTTGHSKGGAMSYIVAAQLISRGNIPNAIISFAAALPGDGDFADYVEEKMAGNAIRRYEVKNDIVPHVPPNLTLWDLLEDAFGRNEDDLAGWDYDSVGQLYYYGMDGDLTIPSSKASRALLYIKRLATLGEAVARGQFGEIVNEHSLTGSYGPLICPDLPYGDATIDSRDGF